MTDCEAEDDRTPTELKTLISEERRLQEVAGPFLSTPPNTDIQSEVQQLRIRKMRTWLAGGRKPTESITMNLVEI